MENTDRYETSDLYEAAYLNCCGVPMTSERRGSRCFFTFAAAQPVLARLRHAYFDGSGQVSAFSYAERVRGLKQIACGER